MSAPAADAIGVALIGYGYAGRTFHAPLIAATPGLQLLVVASRDAGKIRADGIDADVIADPVAAILDPRVALVVLASPNDTHAPLAHAALDAGKHVVVDKPLTLNLDDARVLAALARQRGLLLSVFHNRRWDSDFLAIRDAIDAHRVGDVMHLETHFDRFRPQVRDRWRERDVPGGGIWFDLGPHLIDQTLQLLGLPSRVTAHFAIQRDGGTAIDWAHVILETGSARAVLHASMLVAGGSPRWLVHGTRGSLLKRGIDPQEAQLLAGMRPGDAGWGVDDDPLLVFDDSGCVAHRLTPPPGDQRCYYAMLVDALHDRGPAPVTTAQAVAVMAVLDAALASARTGCSQPLTLTGREQDDWRRDTAAPARRRRRRSGLGA